MILVTRKFSKRPTTMLTKIRDTHIDLSEVVAIVKHSNDGVSVLMRGGAEVRIIAHGKDAVEVAHNELLAHLAKFVAPASAATA